MCYAVQRRAPKDLSTTKLGKPTDSNPSYRNDCCFWNAPQSLSALGFLIKFRVQFVTAGENLQCSLEVQSHFQFNKSNFLPWPASAAESETEHRFPKLLPTTSSVCLWAASDTALWVHRREGMQHQFVFTWDYNVTSYRNRYTQTLRFFITVQEPKMNWKITRNVISIRKRNLGKNEVLPVQLLHITSTEWVSFQKDYFKRQITQFLQWLYKS